MTESVTVKVVYSPSGGFALEFNKPVVFIDFSPEQAVMIMRRLNVVPIVHPDAYSGNGVGPKTIEPALVEEEDNEPLIEEFDRQDTWALWLIDLLENHHGFEHQRGVARSYDRAWGVPRPYKLLSWTGTSKEELAQAASKWFASARALGMRVIRWRRWPEFTREGERYQLTMRFYFAEAPGYFDSEENPS